MTPFLFHQVVEDIRAAPEDERFDRLKNLLDRSNVYAQFLLKRMDQQREQEKLQREAKEKTRGKRAEEMAKMKEVSQVVVISHRLSYYYKRMPSDS